MRLNGSTIIGSRSVLATAAGLAAAVVLVWPSTGSGQGEPPDPAKHAHQHQAAPAGDSLGDQLQQLRAKVAALEAALEQKHQGNTPAQRSGSAPGMGMMGNMGQGGMGSGMMGGGSGMGQGGMGSGMMGGGSGMGQGGMPIIEDMSMIGIGAMGRARGMAGMTMGSALPGFPGASHLYHVGSTGFFLDHDEHITLTDAQKKELNRIKEQALLTSATAGRKIDEAEQALWTLSAADEPDVEGIAAKVKEIEAIRADQRLAYIRAVGEAAKVLTDDQRQALAGTATANP